MRNYHPDIIKSKCFSFKNTIEKKGELFLMEDEENYICQSCGMPIKNHDDFGTEKNGEKTPYYCSYCYMRGNFLEPELTASEMIEVCAKKYETTGIMPYKQAYELNLQIIPELKRWKSEFIEKSAD